MMFQNILTTAAVVLLIVSLCGCGGSDPDQRGERVGVSGEVTLDGEPLSRARIIFSSDRGSGAVKATGLIEDGKFSISKQEGPLPGSARVEIHPEILELEEFEAAREGDRRKPVEPKAVSIPPRYNSRSQLTAQISPEGDNTLGFELTSK